MEKDNGKNWIDGLVDEFIRGEVGRGGDPLGDVRLDPGRWVVAGGGIGWATPAANHSKSSVYFIADALNINYLYFLSSRYQAATMELLAGNRT